MKGKGVASPWILMVLLANLVFLPAAELGAQSQHTAHTLKLDGEGTMVPATVAEVAWMVGHWRGEGLGGVAEEIWSTPLAGTMMGAFRLVKEDQVAFYELLTFVEEAGSVVLKLKHFHPDLSGWEEKTAESSIRFPLVKLAPTAAYFRGLTFEKTDGNTLVIYLALRSKDGTVREEKFILHRVKN
jgi:hypothetical protein